MSTLTLSPPAFHARVALAEYTLTVEVSTNRNTTTQMTRSPWMRSDRKSVNPPVMAQRERTPPLKRRPRSS